MITNHFHHSLKVPFDTVFSNENSYVLQLEDVKAFPELKESGTYLFLDFIEEKTI